MINTKTSASSVRFHCREKIGKKYEEWDGYVKSIRNYGSHYEIQIQSRSGFVFMIGNYINGAFVSIPAFGVGCDISGYDDYFWNNEHLAKFMNPVDAATVAEALRTLNFKKYI